MMPLMRRLPATLRLASALPRHSVRWPAAATRSCPRGLLASGSASASGRSSSTSVGRCFSSATNTAEAKPKFFLISGQYWMGIIAGKAAMTAAFCVPAVLGDSNFLDLVVGPFWRCLSLEVQNLLCGIAPLWVGMTVAGRISFSKSPILGRSYFAAIGIGLLTGFGQTLLIGIGLLATSCLNPLKPDWTFTGLKELLYAFPRLAQRTFSVWDVPDEKQVDGFVETLACEDKMLPAGDRGGTEGSRSGSP